LNIRTYQKFRKAKRGQHAPKQSAAAARFLFFKKRTFPLSDKGSISAEMTGENPGILPNFEAAFWGSA
jgi:hypothetical protein